MLRIVLRRLLLAVPVLVGVMTISFVATISAPGDPLAGLLPENPTPEQYQFVAGEFGLDRPAPEQWLRYLVRTAQGNLGRSLRTRQPVVQDLSRAATATLELALTAFVLTTIAGVTLGVVSATHENKPVDHVLTVVSIGGVAAP